MFSFQTRPRGSKVTNELAHGNIIRSSRSQDPHKGVWPHKLCFHPWKSPFPFTDPLCTLGRCSLSWRHHRWDNGLRRLSELFRGNIKNPWHHGKTVAKECEKESKLCAQLFCCADHSYVKTKISVGVLTPRAEYSRAALPLSSWVLTVLAACFDSRKPGELQLLCLMLKSILKTFE